MEKERHRSLPVPLHGNLGIGLLKTIEKQTGVNLTNRDKP
jgi:predicted RNA binding protein YcfA (HicA-like mRNA interferase family)